MILKKLYTCLLALLIVAMSVVNINADEDTIYGIVSFEGVNEYTSVYNGDTSFDAGYGYDAAYLYTEDGNVYFKISGDIGYISEDEVEVIPYDETNDRVSKYVTRNGILYHNIKTSIDNDYYTYSLAIDDKPDYLEDNATYYSYDGKYFYTSFNEMIDDYLSDTSESAVNNDNPYYNYYLYLPVRSYTNITLEETEDYFYNTLKIDGKLTSYSDLSNDGANDVVNKSQYYGEFASFFAYEEIYGTNAMRLLAESINESSYGKSYESYTNNNVYTSAAYDSDEERENGRFNNIDTSIYSHAKYFLSRAYANNKYDDYKGSELGNKKSGVTSYYSSDVYNGEKVASYYYQLDSSLGYKDKNAYRIGIIGNADTITVYKNVEESEILFTTDNQHDYPLIILEDQDDVYKVQVDPSFNTDYLYDPESSVGYIDGEVFDYFIGNNEIKENNYYDIDFEFWDGALHGEGYLSLKIKEGKTPVMVNPYLDGYELMNYDTELEPATVDKEYEAVYAEINSVEISSKAKKESLDESHLDISGGMLKINYDGYPSKEISFSTNYLKGVEDGKLILDYNIFEVSQYANILEEAEDNIEELDEIISSNIDSYLSDGSYDLDALKKAKNMLQTMDYNLSFDEIRILDSIFMNETRDSVNYSFEKFDHDISVSGLALAMKEPGILRILKPFKDTYFIRIGNVSSKNSDISNGVASAYGFEEVMSLKLNIQFNLRSATLNSPIVVSLKIDDKDDYNIYTVYHVGSDGNVIKCLTSQSDNYIQFITDEAGDYFVYKKPGFNDYSFSDYYENLNINTADADNHLLFINGSILFAIGVIGAAVIVVHIMLNRKQEKIWKDYKKSWQPVVSPQDEKPKN